MLFINHNFEKKETKYFGYFLWGKWESSFPWDHGFIQILANRSCGLEGIAHSYTSNKQNSNTIQWALEAHLTLSVWVKAFWT